MAGQARIIDGKAAAAELRAEIAREIATLRAATELAPGLHVVLVGDDPASRVYVASKEKLAAEVGMHSVAHRLPAETSEAALLAKLAELNADDAVDGILVQLPLPKHIDTAAIIDAIDPAKLGSACRSSTGRGARKGGGRRCAGHRGRGRGSGGHRGGGREHPSPRRPHRKLAHHAVHDEAHRHVRVRLGGARHPPAGVRPGVASG